MLAAQASDEDEFSSSSAYAHFLKARLAHHEGNHRIAVEELRLALASDGTNPFLMTALAEEYARLSDLPGAERTLKRVIEGRPGYAPAQLLMGRVLLEAGRYTRAKAHLEKAIQLEPKSVQAYLVLTQLHLDSKAADEAVRTIERLGAALPNEAVGYRRLGLAFAERDDLPRAEKLLKKAVERDDRDFDSWYALGQLYESRDRLELAEHAYARALEADPENADLLLTPGRLQLRLGSLGRARAYFDTLLSAAPEPETAVKIAFSYLASRHVEAAAEVLRHARRSMNEPRLHFYAGLLEERLGHFAEAAKAYGDVPESSELHPKARLQRGSCLSQAGQHKEALALLKKSIDERPDYAPLVPIYARALERSGAWRDAESFLKRALAKREDTDWVEALAGTYERQGRFQEALDVLLEALRARPNDESLLFSLGAVYERKGDHDKSMQAMRAVLDINPENALAMNFIGYSLADRGVNFEEAERLVMRALELKPDSGEFLDSLGWLHFRRGDFTRAVDLLERAAALAPGEPTIHEHLGDAYRQSSRPGQARDAYQRALETLRRSPERAESKHQRASLEKKLKQLSVEMAADR